MRTCFALLLLLLPPLARADVVSTTTAGNTAAVTNIQSNFAWSPTAVVVSFAEPVSATITVSRHGNGNAVTLATTTLNATRFAVWAPETDFVFPKDSALVVSSSVAGFTLQLHRKAAP